MVQNIHIYRNFRLTGISEPEWVTMKKRKRAIGLFDPYS